MFKRSRIDLTWVIAAVLILAAGIGVFTVLMRNTKTTTVMTAVVNLDPYQVVTSAQLSAVSVPTASVTSSDLTQSAYQADYASQSLVPLVPILSGQRIDTSAVTASPAQSFSAVLPDEMVVAVNATVTGSVNANIHPGDVVDVSFSSSGGTDTVVESDYAKVLCVAVSPTDCKGVRPPESQLASVKDSGASNSGVVRVLLAMAKLDAQQFSGQTVEFALNTFCSFDQNGYFTSIRSTAALACHAPATRMAAQTPPKPVTTPATTTPAATTPAATAPAQVSSAATAGK